MISRSRGRFTGQVRVQEEERRAAHADAPDEEVDVPFAHAHGHDRRDARRRREDVDRQVVRVGDRIRLLLPRVRRERLAEESLAVEEADPDERHAEVARGLEMVAREDAEPARVDGQDLREPELGAEVGDPVARRRERGRDGVARRGRVLRVDRPRHGEDARHEGLVRGQGRETRRIGGPEQDDRVSASLPLLRVDVAKERAHFLAPGRAEIARERRERRERFGKGGREPVGAERTHGKPGG